MIGIIAAISPEGVIGVNGKLPWHYPADLRRFKKITTPHAIVMGRLTWESLPKRPLELRRNIVISSRPVDGVEHYTSVENALNALHGLKQIWFIGGGSIFAEAMQYADLIDLTHVPDTVAGEGLVYFPTIDRVVWEASFRRPLEEDPRLVYQRFTRRKFAR